MPAIHAVTSFSAKGWDLYGKRFVDSFHRYWPEDITLHVFTDGMDESPLMFGNSMWHPLEADPEHEDFVANHSGPEFNDPHDYAKQSVRFCHKVFAITSADLPQHGWRIWLDADIETIAHVTSAHLGEMLPDGKAISFLGRTGMMRPGQPMHSECGFVAYQMRSKPAVELLDSMRWCYVSSSIFGLGDYMQHDSAVFDHYRELHVPENLQHDLSYDQPERTMHPWPGTILGEIMEHNKGPVRKQQAYGAFQ